MNRFTIAQLSQLSGLTAFRIRTWESRYHALEPQRSAGKQRYYSGEQLRRLLNIVSLTESGIKISRLCRLPDEQLFQLVREKWELHKIEDSDFYLSQMIAAGFNYDEEVFDRLLTHCLERLGLKDAWLTILYPLLLRMGLLWRSNLMEIGHEHFIMNLLRQKLLTAIDQLPPPSRKDDTWLLFLPEGEHHEMGLMIAHYLIRTTGRRSVYLGPDVALHTLIKACKDINPDNLLLFHVSLLAKVNDAYMRDLSGKFNGKNIFMSGSLGKSPTDPDPRLNLLSSLEEFCRLL
jgi:DNA-binding transcriptional MerR regulator